MLLRHPSAMSTKHLDMGVWHSRLEMQIGKSSFYRMNLIIYVAKKGMADALTQAPGACGGSTPYEAPFKS